MKSIITELSPNPTEIIAIVSQKGGVGKTTTAINLSIALVAAGRSVLLIDLDPHGYAGYTLVSGLHASGTERILREASITADMITATEIPDLFLAPASPGLGGVESELAMLGDSRTRLHQALSTLQALPFHFDYVVLDCPPAIGLLTLNALAAAHRILLPLTCESFVIEGIPTLLKTISRLRAGLRQALLGVHMLIVQRTQSPSAQGLASTLRQDYGSLMLLTEIPHHDAVREAAERGRPLLAHCLTCDISQAYLELAAEWLTMHEQDQQQEGGRHFRARQERMSSYRDNMRKRIQAWLMDPSSLLYDETWENLRQQDSQVLDEIFREKPLLRRARLLPFLLFLLIITSIFLIWIALRSAENSWWDPLARLINEFEQIVAFIESPPPEIIKPVIVQKPVEIKPKLAPPEVVQTPIPTTSSTPQIAPISPPEIQTTTSELPVVVNPVNPVNPVKPLNPPTLPPPSAPTGGEIVEDASMMKIIDTISSSKPETASNNLPPPVAQEPAVNLNSPKQLNGNQLQYEIPPLPTYRWQAQLLAGRSLKLVKQDSQRFLKDFAPLLKDRTLVITQSRFGDERDDFYRLRVIDFDSLKAALDWCERVRAKGRKCLVTRVSQSQGEH